MPSWAQDDAREYWDAADLYERANGRLYVSADFALPRELSDDDRIELARAFAHELTDHEHLPYTLAIHEGRDENGDKHNPHAHLMFSERQNDGIERGRDEWFRRANSEDPERGGAPKSRTFHGREWMENARERWADLTNQKLAERGRPERVDHRSYARQGIDHEPGRLLPRLQQRPRAKDRASYAEFLRSPDWTCGVVRGFRERPAHTPTLAQASTGTAVAQFNSVRSTRRSLKDQGRFCGAVCSHTSGSSCART